MPEFVNTFYITFLWSSLEIDEQNLRVGIFLRKNSLPICAHYGNIMQKFVTIHHTKSTYRSTFWTRKHYRHESLVGIFTTPRRLSRRLGASRKRADGELRAFPSVHQQEVADTSFPPRVSF